MNEDHADAVALYATKLLGDASASWRLIGVDPEGSDLMADGATLRLPFSARVLTPDAARQEFVRMAREARA
jgi:putative heme iron utilization protein